MSRWREEDLAEAARLVVRLRHERRRAEEEAALRRARAEAHAGGATDPRRQGLWHAATFHAARAALARARLEEAEAVARALAAPGAAAGGEGACA